MLPKGELGVRNQKGIPNERSAKKAYFRKITALILLLIFSLVIPLVVHQIFRLKWNSQYPFIVVTGESMYPTYETGDILLLNGVNPEDIKVGDVIAFNTNGIWDNPEPDPVVHRVLTIYRINDTLYFQTKGDNRPKRDLYLIPSSKIYGVVVDSIPKVGYIILILIRYGLTYILIGVLVVFFIVQYLRDAKKDLNNQNSDSSSMDKKESNSIKNV